MAARKVGIVGLGYVGLPLGVAFAEAGHEVIGLDADARKLEALKAARVTSRTCLRAARCARRRAQRHGRLRGPEALRRDHHLRPDAADQLARAGPHPPRRRTTSLARVLQKGQLVVLESTTYPGTTRERMKPILEESGLGAGEDFHLAFSPERIDPGRTDYTVRTTPKVVGGLTEGCTRAADAVRGDLRQGRRGLGPGAGRADEAAGEHLPLGQHRPGQRARDAVRAARHRHLGGDRRRLDQAVRVHALRAGAGHGRALPAGRPLLPRLQGARAGLLHRVHRAGRKDQPEPAALLRRADRARPQRRREAGAGLEGPAAGGLLQVRRRGHPRVAGAEDHRAAARAGRRGRLSRPARAATV